MYIWMRTSWILLVSRYRIKLSVWIVVWLFELMSNKNWSDTINLCNLIENYAHKKEPCHIWKRACRTDMHKRLICPISFSSHSLCEVVKIVLYAPRLRTTNANRYKISSNIENKNNNTEKRLQNLLRFVVNLSTVVVFYN